MPASKLVEMRIHGVSPEFIRDVHSAGFEDISLSKMVEFRIHGVIKNISSLQKTCWKKEDEK